MPKKPIASILIPTRNAGKEFEKTLAAVFSQKGVSFEALVLDTESNDGTIETAKKFGARIIGTIKQRDFRHGKARNILARSAQGQFLVFLTQDAVPANNEWLKNLLSAFGNEKIAGVYGRQLPKNCAHSFEEMFYKKKYPQKPAEWNSENWSLENILFSNVNAAIPKKLFLQNPFSEQTIVSEDYEWALRMMEKGYSIAYEPRAVVFHSHNLGFWKTFQKHFDIGYSYWQIFSGKHKRYRETFFQSGISYYLELLKSFPKNLKQKDFFWLPKLLVNGATKSTALFAGKKIAPLLPNGINRFFSAQKYYWEKK